MGDTPNTLTKEVKTMVANRVPPGDHWQPIDNTTLTLDCLTEVLEYIYQKTGNTQFFMDAKEGRVYIIDTEEEVIKVEPVKRYSLYGEG